jgi:K+-sensing histidine kinase KdpD
MSFFKRLIKVTCLTIYFAGITYLLIAKDTLNLPDFINTIIPVVFFVSLLAFWLFFIIMFFNKTRYEDEFTQIVNHVFRTPLTGIAWTTSELEKELTNEEKTNLLQNITNLTDKLVEIVDLFIGIKKVEDQSGYNFKATSIRELVERSLVKYRNQIHKKNISLNVSSFRDVPLLTIDLKKIHFVVDSLIENAVLYTPANGKISIDYMTNQNRLIFYVSDTGIGLSLINKCRIFTKFYRGLRARHIYTDGLGLRLYLSRIIIKRHKGKIYFKSRGKDRGSTFFVELPFRK